MTALDIYLQEIIKEYATGIASEHAYRPALKALLESVDSQVIAVNDPKRIAVGAPDFILIKDAMPLCYVEAKDLDKDLKRVERDAQLVRYRKAFHSLLLTNSLEFRWYLDGELQKVVRIGKIRHHQIEFDKLQFDDLQILLQQFMAVGISHIANSHQLADRLANRALQIAQLIEKSLPDSESLQTQKKAFEQTLLPDLKDAQFADMYAQTLAYGLLAARANHIGATGTFSRRGAWDDIPKTNPFLREFFQRILGEMDARIEWMVDDLVKLLAYSDTETIFADFGKRSRREDPVLHFYETFLTEYNPKLREKRGIYYTPESIVNYMIRIVDDVLQQKFMLTDGIADKQTLVLDPATGTGTFLYNLIQHIHATHFQSQIGAWDDYVRDGLLPRLFGFELLMASYAVAHMKLELLLKETGYRFAPNQRLNIFLTNTLEDVDKQAPLPFARFISEEANSAVAIKRKKPIMVVMGNPPYSGHSANRDKDQQGNPTYIGKLLQDYFMLDNAPLKERNSKWLRDDYVKFIRFGQARIRQTGQGILAYVTNHSYLDNPTFCGMRQQLMREFDEIYILNLHGNAKKREIGPEQQRDENLFDIEQGVAIAIFIKLPSNRKSSSQTQATVYYADLWGKRREKSAWLDTHDMNNTAWIRLNPVTPYYLFVPLDTTHQDEYESYWQITQIMRVNSVGIVTGNDAETIAFTKQKAYDLAKIHQLNSDVVLPIVYRPFDERYIVYDASVVTRNRTKVFRNMQLPNLAIVTVRRIPNTAKARYFFITDKLLSNGAIRADNQSIDTVFPLYLYPFDGKFNGEFSSEWQAGEDGRVPNFDPTFIRGLEEKSGLQFSVGQYGIQRTERPSHEQFTPEDVFYYMYALFHATEYRTRYAEFLKIDFPRLPLTSDIVLFRQLGQHGESLVDIHLLKHIGLKDLITTYPISGDNMVEKGYPKWKQGRVYINPTQYIEGVNEPVYEFMIGGYQVLQKWLKDRQSEKLAYEDILHYQKIIVAIQETITIISKIDQLVTAFPLP